MAKETKCKDGLTAFFMNNIPCELMEYYRELSFLNRRAISQEIIIAMEEKKNKIINPSYQAIFDKYIQDYQHSDHPSVVAWRESQLKEKK